MYVCMDEPQWICILDYVLDPVDASLSAFLPIPFLIDALRAPLFDSHVVRHIHKARSEQVARKLMSLQSRRVRITDTRT